MPFGGLSGNSEDGACTPGGWASHRVSLCQFSCQGSSIIEHATLANVKDLLQTPVSCDSKHAEIVSIQPGYNSALKSADFPEDLPAELKSRRLSGRPCL